VVQELTAGDLQLWRKLQRIFGVLAAPAELGMDRKVLRSVQPVVDTRWLDCMFVQREIVYDLQGSAGDFNEGFVVPVDRAFLLMSLHTPVAWTATAVALTVVSPAGTIFNADWSLTATAIRLELNLNIPVPPGWSVGARNTGNAGDSSRTVEYAYYDFPTAQLVTDKPHDP